MLQSTTFPASSLDQGLSSSSPRPPAFPLQPCSESPPPCQTPGRLPPARLPAEPSGPEAGRRPRHSRDLRAPRSPASAPVPPPRRDPSAPRLPAPAPTPALPRPPARRRDPVGGDTADHLPFSAAHPSFSPAPAVCAGAPARRAVLFLGVGARDTRPGRRAGDRDRSTPAELQLPACTGPPGDGRHPGLAPQLPACTAWPGGSRDLTSRAPSRLRRAQHRPRTMRLAGVAPYSDPTCPAPPDGTQVHPLLQIPTCTAPPEGRRERRPRPP